MLLERTILCGAAIVLIGATSASADEPTALTGSQLDGVTALRFLPDQLSRLRITVEGETDDSDSLTDEMILQELEERRLRVATDSPNSAPAGTQNSASAGTQNTAAATTAASGEGATGSWTSSPTSYRISTRTSSATDRVEPARSSSASKDVSRSRTPAWSSRQSRASATLRQRMPNERATTDVISTTASRARASLAQMRAEAGGILRHLRHQAASPRP
jgi:hypothetical protein